MTKAEAEAQWREHYLPSVRAQFEKNGRVDEPARAESWNNYTDALCKNGDITKRQYATWTHPK